MLEDLGVASMPPRIFFLPRRGRVRDAGDRRKDLSLHPILSLLQEALVTLITWIVPMP